LLPKQMARDPDLFFQIFCYAFPKKNAELIKELRKHLSEEQIGKKLMTFYWLFHNWKEIPGLDKETGEVDYDFLLDWIRQSRELAIKKDMMDIMDSQLGKLLARFPEDETQINWPPDGICQIVEKYNSEDLLLGFSVGISNKRSFTIRSAGSGGNIERQRGEYFKKLAARHRNKFPSVAKIFSKESDDYFRKAKREDMDSEKESLE
ncbi:MAG: hypothetical protein AAF740_10110, partial [Bacteroidota bacterium]